MPTWTDQVQAASSIVGVLVAVIGFFFVSYQIRQISQASRAGAHTAIFSHSLELTRLMLDNPEIMPYLYEGKKLLGDEPHHHQVLIACELFCDFYEHVSLQRENLPAQSMICWDKAIADRYQKNTTLRDYLEARRHVYAPDLFASIDKGRKLLDGYEYAS